MNESFAIQGFSASNQMLCMIEGSDIYQTDYMGNKRLLGKTSAAYAELEQTTAVMKDKGLNYPEPEWYAVMNMLYSDYGPLLAKHGPKELDAYVELAKAWLDDKDAMPGKTARYYHSVVRGM